MNEHKSYVETFGPKDHRRCRIVDRERGYWTGEDWNQDASKARLFYTFPDAAREYTLIHTWENLDNPSTEYRATVTVTVFGDQQQNRDELVDFLTEATKLSIVKPGQPLQIQIHWDELELVSEPEPPLDS